MDPNVFELAVTNQLKSKDNNVNSVSLNFSVYYHYLG